MSSLVHPNAPIRRWPIHRCMLRARRRLSGRRPDDTSAGGRVISSGTGICSVSGAMLSRGLSDVEGALEDDFGGTTKGSCGPFRARPRIRPIENVTSALHVSILRKNRQSRRSLPVFFGRLRFADVLRRLLARPPDGPKGKSCHWSIPERVTPLGNAGRWTVARTSAGHRVYTHHGGK